MSQGCWFLFHFFYFLLFEKKEFLEFLCEEINPFFFFFFFFFLLMDSYLRSTDAKFLYFLKTDDLYDVPSIEVSILPFFFFLFLSSYSPSPFFNHSPLSFFQVTVGRGFGLGRALAYHKEDLEEKALQIHGREGLLKKREARRKREEKKRARIQEAEVHQLVLQQGFCFIFFFYFFIFFFLPPPPFTSFSLFFSQFFFLVLFFFCFFFFVCLFSSFSGKESRCPKSISFEGTSKIIHSRNSKRFIIIIYFTNKTK